MLLKLIEIKEKWMVRIYEDFKSFKVHGCHLKTMKYQNFVNDKHMGSINFMTMTYFNIAIKSS